LTLDGCCTYNVSIHTLKNDSVRGGQHAFRFGVRSWEIRPAFPGEIETVWLTLGRGPFACESNLSNFTEQISKESKVTP
jgi:hypothetical protein